MFAVALSRVLRFCWTASAVSLGAPVATATAAIVAVDDAGRTLRLEQPAARVVTLAPSLTELVFAAGGSGRVVAVDGASDYPPAARSLPRIGELSRIDVERIVALRPDLVLVWRGGNTGREVEQLGALGIATFSIGPRRLADVPQALRRIGVLLGTGAVADAAAAAIQARLDELRRRHAGAAPVRVFYQVWSSPLMTVGGGQIVDDAIATCGGQNVFGRVAAVAPHVSVESVLEADPEVVLSADEHGAPVPVRRAADAPAFAAWRRHPRMAATRGGNFFLLDGDAISRQGPRIVDGVAAICRALDAVREASRPR